jgi:hypothetical protein
MRIAVEHDEHGTIKAVFIPTEGHDKHVELRPRPGHRITQVDNEGLLEHPLDAAGLDKLRGYRVHGTGSAAKLLRRAD